MRLTTNFVRNPKILVAPVAASLWCCAVLLAGVSAGLVWSASQYGEETQRLKERQLELTLAYDSLQLDGLKVPGRDQIRELNRTVKILNGLAAFDGLSVSGFLASLEKQLPDQAYLVRFSYKPEFGEAQFVAEAREAAPLTSFLQALEQEEGFQEVLLTRQLRMKRQSIAYTQYEIRMRSGP